MVREYIRSLSIRTPHMEQRVAALSGGNQQKVVIARWLATKPKVLILDEPTRGIDVGAKAEIAALIDDLRRRGMSLLFISSEVEEVAALCSRVVVLRDRRKVGELAGGELSVESILARVAG